MINIFDGTVKFLTLALQHIAPIMLLILAMTMSMTLHIRLWHLMKELKYRNHLLLAYVSFILIVVNFLQIVGLVFIGSATFSCQQNHWEIPFFNNNTVKWMYNSSISSMTNATLTLVLMNIYVGVLTRLKVTGKIFIMMFVPLFIAVGCGVYYKILTYFSIGLCCITLLFIAFRYMKIRSYDKKNFQS